MSDSIATSHSPCVSLDNYRVTVVATAGRECEIPRANHEARRGNRRQWQPSSRDMATRGTTEPKHLRLKILTLRRVGLDKARRQFQALNDRVRNRRGRVEELEAGDD